jgi:hypothetical protein
MGKGLVRFVRHSFWRVDFHRRFSRSQSTAAGQIGHDGMTISATASLPQIRSVHTAAVQLRVPSMMGGFVLLAAAGLKLHHLAHPPSQVQQSPLDAPAVIVPLSISELLLAALLLSGLWPARTRKIAIGGFALAAAFAVGEGAAGRHSCGCFGSVRVSPWVTAAFDLCAVAALVWCKPKDPAAESVVPNSLARAAFAFGIVGAGVSTAAVWEIHRPVFVTADLAATSSADPFGAPDSLVVLEPSGWAGKPFALTKHLDGGPQLANGRWIVLLVHHDCDHCIAAVPQYEAAMPLNGQTKLAIIEMPPYAGPGEEGFAPSPAVSLTGRLDATRDWFAATPVAILLDHGIVQAAADGDKAATPNPAWLSDVRGGSR